MLRRACIFLYDGRGIVSPPRRDILDNGIAEPDRSSTSRWGGPRERQGTWLVDPERIVVGDADSSGSAASTTLKVQWEVQELSE